MLGEAGRRRGGPDRGGRLPTSAGASRRSTRPEGDDVVLDAEPAVGREARRGLRVTITVGALRAGEPRPRPGRRRPRRRLEGRRPGRRAVLRARRLARLGRHGGRGAARGRPRGRDGAARARRRLDGPGRRAAGARARRRAARRRRGLPGPARAVRRGRHDPGPARAARRRPTSAPGCSPRRCAWTRSSSRRCWPPPGCRRSAYAAVLRDGVAGGRRRGARAARRRSGCPCSSSPRGSAPRSGISKVAVGRGARRGARDGVRPRRARDRRGVLAGDRGRVLGDGARRPRGLAAGRGRPAGRRLVRLRGQVLAGRRRARDPAAGRRRR